MAREQVLRIEDEHPRFRVRGENDGGPTGTRKMGKAVAKAIQGVADAMAGKGIDGHGDVPMTLNVAIGPESSFNS